MFTCQGGAKSINYGTRLLLLKGSLSYTHICTDNNYGVKFTLEEAMRPSGGADVQLYFSNIEAIRGWVVKVILTGRFTLRKETLCPLYRMLGELQGRSGRVRKISAPPGLDPWTLEPVAIRSS